MNPHAAVPVVGGQTRLFGILGDPIAQVKSPEAITALFHSWGVNALCLPLHARPEEFDAVLGGLKGLVNFDGYILTVPHKVRAMAHVDNFLPTAKRVGAVNVVRREKNGTWTGDMTDGRGMLAALHKVGFTAKGKRAMVLGCGGAGSAIIDALGDEGAAQVTIHDIDGKKAEALAARLAQAHPNCRFAVSAPSADGFDVLINASPAGMAPKGGMPAQFGKFQSSLFVGDVITDPNVTALLEHARAYGCRFVTGTDMFKAQAEGIARYLVPEKANDR